MEPANTLPLFYIVNARVDDKVRSQPHAIIIHPFETVPLRYIFLLLPLLLSTYFWHSLIFFLFRLGRSVMFVRSLWAKETITRSSFAAGSWPVHPTLTRCLTVTYRISSSVPRQKFVLLLLLRHPPLRFVHVGSVPFGDQVTARRGPAWSARRHLIRCGVSERHQLNDGVPSNDAAVKRSTFSLIR